MNGEDLLVLDQIKSNQELILKKIDSMADKFAKATDRKVNAKEACEIAGISYNTLKKYVKLGIITQFKAKGSDPTYLSSELMEVGEKRYQHSKR